MTALASAFLDAVLPIAIAVAAASWLAWRGWRAIRGTSDGCGCPSSKGGAGCAKTGEMNDALRRAARRAVESSPRA
jgi:hypothetical protein